VDLIYFGYNENCLKVIRENLDNFFIRLKLNSLKEFSSLVLAVIRILEIKSWDTG
jgi:hypothetical protein